MSPSAFRDQVERARKAAGLTRAEVARRAGLSLPGLAKALRPGGNPTLRTMTSIALAVGCELRWTVSVPMDPSAPVVRWPFNPDPDLELSLAA